jgi:hypothetical protein
MSRVLKFALLPALLMAADPAWKNKAIPQWDEEDARQVLADSPWVKHAKPVLLAELTPDQRREGGVTGGGHGIGLDDLKGIDLTGLGGTAKRPERRATQLSSGTLVIRWESAFPVRAAELKAREVGAPDWEGDAYVLAVYDIPDLKVGGNQKSLESELKRAAALKRDGKKDLKPSSVELMQQPSGLAVVVYVFPRTEEISKEDHRLEFVAQIGRLSLAQYFYTEEMELLGKLQL